jgi:DNA replication and repair protein RecF
MTRVKGIGNDTTLEIVMSSGSLAGKQSFIKRYFVNGVGKSRNSFASLFTAVFFSPSDLALITGSPSLRRMFLDNVLEQADSVYRRALLTYEKALRQRNALLHLARETGRRNDKVFEYWDNLIIENGQILTNKREAFIAFLTTAQKDVFNFSIMYDKSIISKERLVQYKDAEVSSGVTLVGPHRDDFWVRMETNKNHAHESEARDIKLFGSRGQQRLAVLQLKLLEITFLEQAKGERPALLLDDIFSELDQRHIALVSDMIGKQQTFLTTTHKEFLKGFSQGPDVIELG